MARTDAVVLGAGIVGTSIALHLAKRGLSVALVDRGGPGKETSYGNAGVIEGDTVFPPAFPPGLISFLRVGLKQAPEANYHLAFLPKVAPWLFNFWLNSRPKKLLEFAYAMRPLFSRAVAEHEALMTEAGALQYLRKTGWAKIYRSEKTFDATAPELNLADELGIPLSRARPAGHARARARAEAAFRARDLLAGRGQPEQSAGGDPRLCRALRSARRRHAESATRARCIATARAGASTPRKAPLDAQQAVVALGPWAPDRAGADGHPSAARHQARLSPPFQARGQRGDDTARWSIPTTAIASRRCSRASALTTGAEFADRDAAPTPVQFDRLMPKAREVYPLGEQVRRADLARQAAVLSGFPPGDRARAGTEGAMAGLRPCALGTDARAGDRPAGRRSGYRRDAVL